MFRPQMSLICRLIFTNQSNFSEFPRIWKSCNRSLTNMQTN
jgi:hypothetical protein